MKDLKKIFFVLLTILFLLSNYTSYAQADTFTDWLKNVNPDIVTNPTNATVFQENCSQFPGFINRIIQCIEQTTTQSAIFSNLMLLNKQFAMVADAALVLYVMFFGLKLSMNVVDNVRGEIVVVLLTCFFITYVNNGIRMQNFVKFFIGLQNEFVNVATFSIVGAQENDPEFKKYVCFSDYGSAIKYPTIWNRIDCLIVYILGAHPVITQVGILHDRNTDKLDPASISSVTNITQNVTKTNNYKFAENGADNNVNPVPVERIWDIFDFNRRAYMETLLTLMSGDAQQVLNFITSPNKATLTDLGMSPNEALRIVMQVRANDASYFVKHHPINNNVTTDTISFSLINIMVGELFSDPQFGIIIFIVGILTIILMLAAFAQAMIVYLTSLFAILVLGMFAPLILPTFLFHTTRNIFEKWIQLLFAYSLQPGIVMCYLTFMVYVLQFVVSYKGNISIDSSIVTDCTAASSSTNPNCPHNLAQFQLGLPYTQGVKDTVEAAKISEETTDTLQSAYEKYQMQAALTEKSSTPKNQYNTYINHGMNSFDPLATQVATEDSNELVRKIFNFNSSGTSSKTLEVPGFKFFTGNILGKPDIGSALAKLFMNADVTNGNISNSAQNIQDRIEAIDSLQGDNDPCIKRNGGILDVRATAICLIEEDEQRQYSMKIMYMQSLLIILITLCITLMFLRNVMDFSSKLVGMDVPQVAKALNIYNFSVNKLNRMIKG